MVKLALSLLLAASLARALVVPADLQDGTWIFDLDGAAAPAALPVEDPVLLRAARSLLPPHGPGRLSARQGPPPLPRPQPACLQTSFNPGDFAAARRAFNTMCDRQQQYPASSAVVIAQGGAIAYMCNFPGNPNRCWREEYDEANRIMDASCGAARSAVVRVDAYNKQYGRGNVGENIC